VRAATIADAAYPVIANATARPLRTSDEIRAELLGQTLAPVRWTAVIGAIAATGVAEFVDCGPSGTLAALQKRIVPEAAIVKLDV